MSFYTKDHFTPPPSGQAVTAGYLFDVPGVALVEIREG